MSKLLKNIYRLILLLICFTFLMLPSMAVNAASSDVLVMYMGSRLMVSGYELESSNPRIASISTRESGNKSVITPMKQGCATIKYYKGKKLKKKSSLLVLKKNNIKFNTKPVSIKVGEKKNAACTAYKKCTIKYSSSNKGIASVNKKGTIKGISKGNCTITVKVMYKGVTIKKFSKQVNVTGTETAKPDDDDNDDDKATKLKSIKVTCSKKSVPEGYEFSLNDFTVYGYYTDGSKKLLGNFTVETTYASSNGYYKILVKSGGLETTIKVPVTKESSKPAKKAIGIEASANMSEIPAGHSFSRDDFTVYTLYSDGTKEANKTFGYRAVYTSGYYNITISSGDFSKSLKVKAVVEGEPDPEKKIVDIEASVNVSSVQEGYSFQRSDFSVNAVYSDGTKDPVTGFSVDILYKNGKYELTVNYLSFTKKLTVEAVKKSEDNVPEPNEKTAFNKAQVPFGYNFKIEDFTVYTLYADGTKKPASGYGFKSVYRDGYYYLTVTSGKFTEQIIVKAVPTDETTPSGKTAVDIEVEFNKTEVPAGYDFKLDDFTVYILYSDGTKAIASGYGFKTQYENGYYNVTVKSGSFSKSFKVKAVMNPESDPEKPYVKSAKFSLSPDTVKVNKNLDKDQIKVTAIYSDGTEKNVTDFILTLYDHSKAYHLLFE